MTFEDWKSDFLLRAAGSASPVTLDECALLMSQHPPVTKADATQAEARKTLWQYLDITVSDTRIAAGKTKLVENKPVFDLVEQRFPVPREIVAAVWGLETNFGSIRGDVPVFASLSTMAHQGRRRAMFEDQLLAALKMVDLDLCSADQMVGSWAGAMGHTQFMPRAYLDHAVSANGGTPNIWGEDPSDALLSTANYLSQSGWQANISASIEVVWPKMMDLQLAHKSPALSLDAWEDQGVRPVTPIAENGTFRFLLPAGHRGPGFLISCNHDAILQYNNANPYALAVAHLADRLANKSALQTIRHDDPRGLSQSEVAMAQSALTQLGFDTQGADGFIGPNTVVALERFQTEHGLPIDGHLDLNILQKLTALVQKTP